MSLFDQLFESAIEKSKSIKKMASALVTFAAEMTKTKETLLELIDVVNAHNDAIRALSMNQSALAAALKSSSFDSQMPDIDKEKAQKPN